MALGTMVDVSTDVGRASLDWFLEVEITRWAVTADPLSELGGDHDTDSLTGPPPVLVGPTWDAAAGADGLPRVRR